MPSFIQPSGSNSNLNADFFQEAINLRNRRGGGSVTIDDLAASRQDRRSEEGSGAENNTQSSNRSSSTSRQFSAERTIETGRSEDVRTNGDTLIGVEVGGQQRFAESVSLSVDDEGNVRDDISGGQIQQEVENPDGEVDVETLQLREDQQTIDAQATSEVAFSGNLSDQLANGETAEFQAEITDAQGQNQQVTFQATRTDSNQVELTASDPESGDTALRATLEFDQDGEVQQAELQANDAGQDGLTVSSGSAAENTIAAENLDFTSLSLAEGETTAGVSNVDGNEAGQLESLSVSDQGQIQGQFSNGQTRDFGEIATAEFENADQLAAAPRGTFTESTGSGEANFSADAEIQSGELQSQDAENTSQILSDLLDDAPQQNRQQILGSALDLFG